MRNLIILANQFIKKSMELQYYSDNDNYYDVAELIEMAKSLPIEKIAVENLKLSTMYDDLEENLNRIKNANLKYPIIITPDGFVADGMHRIMKAMCEGKEFVLAKRLKQMPKPLPQEAVDKWNRLIDEK